VGAGDTPSQNNIGLIIFDGTPQCAFSEKIKKELSKHISPI